MRRTTKPGSESGSRCGPMPRAVHGRSHTPSSEGAVPLPLRGEHKVDHVILGPFLTRAEKWHFLALSGTISGARVSDLPYAQRFTILRRPISATFRGFFAPTGIVLRIIPSRNIKARNDFSGQRLTWHWRVDLFFACTARSRSSNVAQRCQR
jgi:hypothetical protein